MPKRRQPYSHTSLWITDCHQSSMGTSGCSRLCYANGKPITKGRRRCTVFGGPSLLFDPGYGALIRVTFTVLREGRTYPQNPFNLGDRYGRLPRRKPTPISARPSTPKALETPPCPSPKHSRRNAKPKRR